jgi:VIT1/CCC1 family predicted Fe2+/Mn2+ transporter
VQVTSGETLPVPASLTQAPTPTPKTPTTVLSVIVALFISGAIAAKTQGRKYKK